MTATKGNYILRAASAGLITGTICGAAVFVSANSSASTSEVLVSTSQTGEHVDREDTKGLLDQWFMETAFHSSPSIILKSEAYRSAVEMRGSAIVEDLLSMIDDAPYHCILALSQHVKPWPFSDEESADLEVLCKKLKLWGQERDGGHGFDGLGEQLSEFETYSVEAN
jgi:hypothetical protein